MGKRMFPVLWQGSPKDMAELRELMCPRSVPWEMVAPHEAQAQYNHGQTLERLAERGGLSPMELACVLADHHWRWSMSLPPATTVALLKRFIDEWEAAQ
jgi:hypothetical protein